MKQLQMLQMQAALQGQPVPQAPSTARAPAAASATSRASEGGEEDDEDDEEEVEAVGEDDDAPEPNVVWRDDGGASEPATPAAPRENPAVDALHSFGEGTRSNDGSPEKEEANEILRAGGMSSRTSHLVLALASLSVLVPVLALLCRARHRPHDGDDGAHDRGRKSRAGGRKAEARHGRRPPSSAQAEATDLLGKDVLDDELSAEEEEEAEPAGAAHQTPKQVGGERGLANRGGETQSLNRNSAEEEEGGHLTASKMFSSQMD